MACTEEAKPGIIAEVRNAMGGEALAEGSTLTLWDGDYVEVVDQPMDSLRLAGAWDRPGVYDVRVGREGWAPWRVIGIEVETDACHVTPVVLDAFLIELDR